MLPRFVSDRPSSYTLYLVAHLPLLSIHPPFSLVGKALIFDFRDEFSLNNKPGGESYQSVQRLGTLTAMGARKDGSPPNEREIRGRVRGVP